MSLVTGAGVSTQNPAAEAKASRILFVDIAKGIAICSVLLCHLPQRPLVMNWLVVWNMPLFIAVSGVFDRGLPWRESFKKTAPLIWAYLGYGLLACLGVLVVDREFALNRLLVASPVSVWSLPLFGHFWFIAALVAIKLLTALPYGRSLWAWGALALVGWVWGSQFSHQAQTFPLMLGPALLLGVYYVSGPLLLKLAQRGWMFKASAFLVFWAAFAVVLMLYPLMRTRMFNYHLVTVADPISAAVLGFSGILCLFFVAQFIGARLGFLGSMLGYVGRHSFSFFVLHLAAFFFFRTAISKMGIHVGWIQNCGCFAFALMVGYLHSLARRRYDARLTPFQRSVIFAAAK